jgi:hypothetical protein
MQNRSEEKCKKGMEGGKEEEKKERTNLSPRGLETSMALHQNH